MMASVADYDIGRLMDELAVARDTLTHFAASPTGERCLDSVQSMYHRVQEPDCSVSYLRFRTRPMRWHL
jgi:hypothetical protein